MACDLEFDSVCSVSSAVVLAIVVLFKLPENNWLFVSLYILQVGLSLSTSQLGMNVFLFLYGQKYRAQYNVYG